ncbi:MAG TPA: Xaa-Pro peptidase family protein [Gaiellales bacterium]|jgi:Xaa-Pro aminopeptidase|nr:Xaa-Pro peptidase family protein [Gaiellales bacterium]
MGEQIELIDRLRAALAETGLERAVLSHPETLAHLCLFDPAVEEWPVANPFVASPALLVLDSDEATLLVASFHAAHAARSPVPVEQYRSYDWQSAPAPEVELEAALREVTGGPGRIGVETASLPVGVAEVLRAEGAELVEVDELVVRARRIKLPLEIAAIRRASRLSDIVQSAVKELAHPGVSEAEVAATAQAAMASEAGRRVPAILTVTTGEATTTGGWEATDRLIETGDLVLCDTSPWIDGHWSDSANAVCAGRPSAEQRRIFDRVRRALELAIRVSQPGALACDIDATVRAELSDLGPTYGHHTGHGIGASWSEPPRITPYERIRLEEGMVLAVEPAFYAPGFGGIRLEHVFVVRAGGNEVITEFEHTL